MVKNPDITNTGEKAGNDKKMDILDQHSVPVNTSPERLRTYAQKIFKTYYPSNKGIKKAIEKGLFLVNEIKASTATQINPGDTISLLKPSISSINKFSLNLEIVFEDSYLAVINKKAGIPVHSYGLRNIRNALVTELKKSKHPDALPLPLAMHRLDTPTTGLLIVAKTRKAQVGIGKLFENRTLEKTYTAITLGKVEKEGKIEMPIEGKEAISGFVCMDQRTSQKFGVLSLLKLYPKTGRTHQLRIHCASLGHPILGERKYSQDIPNMKGKGLFLAATGLSFVHPVTGKKMKIEIQPPKKFSRYFDL